MGLGDALKWETWNRPVTPEEAWRRFNVPVVVILLLFASCLGLGAVLLQNQSQATALCVRLYNVTGAETWSYAAWGGCRLTEVRSTSGAPSNGFTSGLPDWWNKTTTATTAT